MNANKVKEDCDRMNNEQILRRIRAICKENGLPSTGWKPYYVIRPGPKCFKRVLKGSVTHTAYVQSFWIDIVRPGDTRPMLQGGLTG